MAKVTCMKVGKHIYLYIKIEILNISEQQYATQKGNCRTSAVYSQINSRISTAKNISFFFWRYCKVTMDLQPKHLFSISLISGASASIGFLLMHPCWRDSTSPFVIATIVTRTESEIFVLHFSFVTKRKQGTQKCFIYLVTAFKVGISSHSKEFFSLMVVLLTQYIMIHSPNRDPAVRI